MNQPLKIFDFVFINPGFEDFLIIETKINEGLKILIVLENELQRDDIFYTTQFFPFSFFALRRKLKEIKIWRKLVELAPHLAQPKKVFYPSYSMLYKYRAMLADYLFKNQFQKRMHVITHGLHSISSKLKKVAYEGIYFQEYRFNISRFYIEMLKSFESNGAEVYINQLFKQENDRFILKNQKKEIRTKNIFFGKNTWEPVYELPFSVPKGFSMFVRHPFGKFRFSEKNGILVVDLVDKSKKKCSENELRILVADYFQFDVDTFEMREKQQLSFSLKIISPLLLHGKQILSSTFEDQGFEEMFELCREKFDLAKQCGINFPEFQVLFHRYGKGIEEMTEMVYEKMNEKKDVESFWDQVENEFQKLYEWKI